MTVPPPNLFVPPAPVTHITHATWDPDQPPRDNDASLALHNMDRTKWKLVERRTSNNPLCKQVIDTCYWESRG